MADSPTGPQMPARIRVWADELQRSSWVLVPRSAATVSDIARSVASKLGLPDAPGEQPAYDIYMADSLVLESEDARLIRDGDEVAIRNKRARTGRANHLEQPAAKRARRDADVAAAASASLQDHVQVKRVLGNAFGAGREVLTGDGDDGGREKAALNSRESPAGPMTKKILNENPSTPGSVKDRVAPVQGAPVRPTFQPTKPRRPKASTETEVGRNTASPPAGRVAQKSGPEKPESAKEATAGGAHKAANKTPAPVTPLNEKQAEANRQGNKGTLQNARKSTNIYTAGRKTHRDGDKPHNSYFDTGYGRDMDHGSPRGRRDHAGWDNPDGGRRREQRGYGGRMEYDHDHGRGYRGDPISNYFDTGGRGGRRKHPEHEEGRDYRGDRDRQGYPPNDRYQRGNREGEEDPEQMAKRAREKALNERQHNKSFFVGPPPPKGVQKDINKQKSSVATNPGSSTVPDASKELAQLLEKDSPPKATALSQETAESKTLSDAVCDNTRTGDGCTILDMLAGVPRSAAKEDPGLFCRLQILLLTGPAAPPANIQSGWIHVKLASLPTEKGELCVIETNFKSLAALQRSEARQRAAGAGGWRRGMEIEEGRPILLEAEKVARFSFDITRLEPGAGDSLPKSYPANAAVVTAKEVKNASVPNQGAAEEMGSATPAEEVATGYENLAKPQTGYENLPSAKTGYESLPAAKTGYESLARPKMAGGESSEHAPEQARENAPAVTAVGGGKGQPDASDTQMPDIDGLPSAEAPFPVGLDDSGEYPPLEAIDSVLGDLGTADDADGKGDGAAGAQAGKEEKKAKSPPARRGGAAGGDAGKRRGRAGRGGKKSAPRPSSNSPDSVIDLMEESPEVEEAARKEAEEFNAFRESTARVMNGVQKAVADLAVLVGEKDDGL